MTSKEAYLATGLDRVKGCNLDGSNLTSLWTIQKQVLITEMLVSLCVLLTYEVMTVSG